MHYTIKLLNLNETKLRMMFNTAQLYCLEVTFKSVIVQGILQTTCS